jgi:23S rRNA (cytosine1962-C5)-methyltransferase
VLRQRRGHPWIYRSDVEHVGVDVRGGDLVGVRLPSGKSAGVALYSDASQIALRAMPLSQETADEDGIRGLVERAVARRAGRPEACRLVHGDADGLPGLVVDRYGPALSLQCLTQGMARREPELVELLRALTGASLVVARNDVRVREFEGLAQEKGVRYAAADAPEPRAVEASLLGMSLDFDLLDGQKTGAFLDQTDNRAAVAARAHGEALDCFSYDGGFALALAKAGVSVSAVDSSGPALVRLASRARRNGLQVTCLEENVFDLLRTCESEGRRFDTIVLDPPAFAKSRDSVDAGRRAYKEINLRALKLLRPGGLLVTCSCSAHTDRSAFDQMLADAAADARRWVRVLERRGAAPDHPVLATAPETDYLKVVLAEVE